MDTPFLDELHVHGKSWRHSCYTREKKRDVAEDPRMPGFVGLICRFCCFVRRLDPGDFSSAITPPHRMIRMMGLKRFCAFL